MANHASAKKRIRQNIKRNALNKSLKSEARTLLKNLNKNIETKADAKETQESLKSVQSAISKLGRKSIFHPNKAARIVSRVAKKSNK